MDIIPAIDLKDGRCVRLRKGDFNTVHSVADDALETARSFERAGASWIHIVDLDGALTGNENNRDIVSKIAAQTGLKVELGGGVRSMEAVEAALSLGVSRVILGSAAAENPDLVAKTVVMYGERIAVGIDAKDGIVRVSGWTESAGLDCFSFAADMERAGVKTIIFTDIDRDGMLTGPPLDSLRKMRETVAVSIIASGGVSSLDDLLRLRDLGVEGAIVGKAIYTGDVDLRKAVEACG
ncbi:1-(5-phosphoribosyl)-5-[(5-phosphoribosylamino)methylideneamino]imidazole-4-carboxamide isomerase [Oscillospiraceae bacterium OttesenSCG-928-G22]|nr:1-(5-phosphoribosyl)-5-[(5-phosphoribosylamino)methylideneamino]imidazole-4-carboxamide isomerase [Oscillospiraceae bacterium OttesenSCG-928-G22]